MKDTVVFLRRQRIPITRKEMLESLPITGRLLIEDAWRERSGASRRFFREATLHSIDKYRGPRGPSPQTAF